MPVAGLVLSNLQERSLPFLGSSDRTSHDLHELVHALGIRETAEKKSAPDYLTRKTFGSKRLPPATKAAAVLTEQGKPLERALPLRRSPVAKATSRKSTQKRKRQQRKKGVDKLKKKAKVAAPLTRQRKPKGKRR